MNVKLIAKNGIAKSVNITCTPLEYLVMKTALHHLSGVNVDDVAVAGRMSEEAGKIEVVEV